MADEMKLIFTRLQKIRSMIVGNPNLAEMYGVFPCSQTSSCLLCLLHNLPRSLKYKLPDKLRLHPAQAITLRTSTHIQG